MRADSAPDHGSLALLAQRDAAAELRPLLLRVQVQNFASAQRRDAASVANFETIALGLIPLVPDDSIAEAASLLRDVAATPPAVAEALAARARPAAPPQPQAPRLDVLRTLASEAPLDGRVVAEMVEEAARRPDLAAAILARPEPTLFDRAALYRHADDATREAIRLDLIHALATVRADRPAGAGEIARDIMHLAESRDPAALLDAIAARIGADAEDVEIVSTAGQELFVFALRAIGLEPCEVTRVLIVCGAPLSRSIEAVFRLTRLALDVPLPVAAYLAGPERIAARPRREMGGEPARAAGTLRADGRADPIRPAKPTARRRRDRDPIARADRRS